MINLTRQQRNTLFVILAIIFVASIAYSFCFRITPAVDARAYDNIARNIVQGNGYREALDVPISNDNSIIRVGPGYEFFLSFLYLVFGYHYEVVWIIQSLLLTLTAFLIFLLSREVFNKQWTFKEGLVAASLIGFSPDLITMQGMLMTETLGIFLLVLCTYLFFRYFDTQKCYQSALIALVLGLATLVRTPTILLAIPIAVYLLWQKRWKDIFVMATVGSLVFVPWTIRNYRVYGELIPTNLASGFNLLAGNHHGANGEQEPYSPLDEYVARYGHVEANHRATQDTISFVKEHPFEYIKLTFMRASIYFSFARPTGFWFHLHGISKAITLTTSALYAAILFVLGFWGIGAYVKERKKYGNKPMMFLAMLIMMPLAIIPIIVETRYRMPVYPFFAIFAGFGFQKLRDSSRCLTCFSFIVFLVFANTSFDVISNIGRILERISNL